MSENRCEGLVVMAEPMGRAKQVCRKLVEEVRQSDGAMLLAADPTWAGAINTVLVKRGVRVSELRHACSNSHSK